MKLIQELIDSAVRELEKGSRSSDMVGNLPYYPMFLTINGKHPETEREKELAYTLSSDASFLQPLP